MANMWPLVGGGALIGLAAALLMALTGRIAGISGIYGRLIGGDMGRGGWQLFFMAGLILPVFLMPRPELTSPVAAYAMILAGLLVGLGTRIGSGCTSGHGVCGIANFSWRSLVATLMFMFSAAMTVFVIRHVLA